MKITPPRSGRRNMAATSSLRFLLPVSRASDHELILSLVDRKICSSFLVLVLDLVDQIGGKGTFCTDVSSKIV
jgi:hypothetical protein